mmetsp:Transcript_3845/g.11683  ORF Transcript_3845/g.11683 Transcript_3845/m.11683 type:complete len:235 (+) Transcript_3845:114-818(+)
MASSRAFLHRRRIWPSPAAAAGSGLIGGSSSTPGSSSSSSKSCSLTNLRMSWSVSIHTASCLCLQMYSSASRKGRSTASRGVSSIGGSSASDGKCFSKAGANAKNSAMKGFWARASQKNLTSSTSSAAALPGSVRCSPRTATLMYLSTALEYRPTAAANRDSPPPAAWRTPPPTSPPPPAAAPASPARAFATAAVLGALAEALLVFLAGAAGIRGLKSGPMTNSTASSVLASSM